jgi:hypothetical protein
MPPRVLGGERIQEDGDEGSDILDHNSLSVEVGNHGSIRGGYGVVGLGHNLLL